MTTKRSWRRVDYIDRIWTKALARSDKEVQKRLREIAKERSNYEHLSDKWIYATGRMRELCWFLRLSEREVLYEFQRKNMAL